MARDFDFEEISFYCRSPIFMCPDCSHAPKCRDLLNLLRIYRLEEKPPEPDYRKLFPWTRPRPDGDVDPNNKLNELGSGEWLKFTRTVLTETFPKTLGHELRRKHPDYKSPFLLGQLLAFFTKERDMILDPFAGTGSTLVAAALMNRESVGFELYKKWIDIYYEICKTHEIPRQKLVQGDCVHLSRYLPAESVDFILMDPPNILKPVEWLGKDLKGEQAFDLFFSMMEELFVNCRKVLRNKKYLAVFTKNLYQEGGYVYITPHFAAAGQHAGFILKGEKIWENTAEKLRPYGYPHTYVPNVVHYNILIFQKSV